ncbi:hypothetical protein V6N11_070384 [Hibiscus sabdariffa]|uniref:Uncharacterized protein n=1 Tax=Hibiscus sabdariffa TaxID=183260 RepID=A0ABR2QEU7_9ROSI
MIDIFYKSFTLSKWLLLGSLSYKEIGPVQIQLCFMSLLRRQLYLDRWDKAAILYGLQFNPCAWVFSIRRWRVAARQGLEELSFLLGGVLFDFDCV